MNIHFLRVPIRPAALMPALAAALAAALVTPPAAAQWVGDATRLGAFAGAMRYCEERYGGDERRYRFARLRVASAVDDLSGNGKFRALAARDRAYERGQFLGNKLDKRECRGLLRASEWKAFSD